VHLFGYLFSWLLTRITFVLVHLSFVFYFHCSDLLLGSYVLSVSHGCVYVRHHIYDSPLFYDGMWCTFWN